MSDIPILFSGSMIRANRQGLKTNTRRELKPQPKVLNNGCWYRPFPQDRSNWQYALGGIIHAYAKVKIVEGDRLWVRETWSHTGDHVFSISEARCAISGYPIYQADENPDYPHAKFWPSIHMPREFSRMTLIVTGIKIERLRDISREDAIAEGLEWVAPTYGIPGIASTWHGDPRESYFALWDHINGAGAAAKNPWVIAYAYSVRHCKIDAMSKEAA